MRSFFIKTKKSEGGAVLYAKIKKNNVVVWLNTGIEVDIARWQKCGGNLDAYARTKAGAEVEKKCRQVDEAITQLMKAEADKDEIRRAIEKIVNAELYAQLEEEKRQEEEERQKQIAAQHQEEKRHRDDVLAYVDELIKNMKNGTAIIEGKGQNRGERYTIGTIKNYNNIRLILHDFQDGKPLEWGGIDKRWATKFVAYMENRGLMKKTVNKYVTTLKAIINRAMMDGRHDDAKKAEYFIKRKVDEQEKSTEIYLTAEEVNALYNMKLTGLQEQCRDMFIVGCCTCQRVSDYTNLSEDNFTTTAKGTPVVRLKQKKTGKVVTIPILDGKLKAIAEKYDYKFPQLWDVYINREIKLICKALSKRVKSLAEELPTILTMKEREIEQRTIERTGKPMWKRDDRGRVLMPRWAMVKTHTARRTGITNLYITGKFDTLQMMHISGHTDAKTFKEYIRLSDEELADKIAEKVSDDLF